MNSHTQVGTGHFAREPLLELCLESVRKMFAALGDLRVGHLYGPYSLEDQEYIATAPADRAAGTAVEEALSGLSFEVSTIDPHSDIVRAAHQCDFVFNNLHGPLGEDGTVQALFDYAGVRYTGSGVRASALALHKPTAKLLSRGCGVDTPEGVVVTSPQAADKAVSGLVAPWIVKPATGGSSIGIEVVDTKEQLEDAVVTARSVASEVLVETYVAGRDLTVGVLDVVDGDVPIPLGIVEVVTESRAYDADAKLRSHWEGEVRYDCPADIDDECVALVRAQTIAIHRAMGCTGYSRTDWRLSDEGKPIFLELNTNPGLSARGNFALSAIGAGLTYSELIMLMSASAMRGS